MTQLTMTPRPDERILCFLGDRIRFSLSCGAEGRPHGWRALLRTDLGRAYESRDEAIAALGAGRPYAGASWHDIALPEHEDGWSIELSMTNIGYFHVKLYAVDEQHHQHWPVGGDAGICVHPDNLRTTNTIYCAFTRAFGVTKDHGHEAPALLEDQFAVLDRYGYNLIPPSGTLRDLVKAVPHIVDTLGCRVLQLLPINPTPTTYARFGRYGSPYAALDFTQIDPALVEFDKTTTAIDQFRELTYAVHLRGAQVFLDLAINHTGWGSLLQNERPEWFERNADGTFHSPGAWGNTWEDLVELDQTSPELWEYLAMAFLIWCRRGVDGFRCDAGYMIPVRAWQYITARVRQEFPYTVFLLEGLGGAWEATEALLTEGGMQWAYSELFQNYSGQEVARYLDHTVRANQRVGLLVHYSETHDNSRLAQGGRMWSLMRNRLSALTSMCGGYGITCGVEWLATQKISVHGSRSLNWNASENIIPEIAQLNRLLAEHPCFFDGADLKRLSAPEDAVFMLRRDSAEGLDTLLILANTDITRLHEARIDGEQFLSAKSPLFDLIDQEEIPILIEADGTVRTTLQPGQCRCLAVSARPSGMTGAHYRRKRAQEAWALSVLGTVMEIQDLGPHDWQELAELVAAGPVRFLACLAHVDAKQSRHDLVSALKTAIDHHDLPQVVAWNRHDLGRITVVPPGHWLFVRDDTPFSASLIPDEPRTPTHVRSVPIAEGHVACFAPNQGTTRINANLVLESFANEGRQAHARIRFLAEGPTLPEQDLAARLVLLTNGLGGMARLCVDFGAITSKYDCLLGANLLANAPCDRHIFAKRARLWVNADGFITPLNSSNLVSFAHGAPARWTFLANAGDRRTVPIEVQVDMLQGKNTTVMHAVRLAESPAGSNDLPSDCLVSLTVRVDIEDRSFHAETHRSPQVDEHFHNHTTVLSERAGFAFSPAGRQLQVFCDRGSYHAAAEWCQGIPHPIDANRGQVGQGDAFSPGWFEIPLERNSAATLVISADATLPEPSVIAGFATERQRFFAQVLTAANFREGDAFGAALVKAATAFVVRRDDLKTIIAGYPWFLDWGRDSLICARGLLAAGLQQDVRQLLIAFGRFEDGGTLPNLLRGTDASDRDTSDAPLWYGVVCEEAAAILGDALYATAVDAGMRTITDVLLGIANGYLRGTANGIRVDRASALVWSPAHFTWMDTNHPAGTPRAGYPIEIQALWIRLLRQLERMQVPTQDESWKALAERALASIQKLYWLEERGYYCDHLIAAPGSGAQQGIQDNALRSNQLILINLALVDGDRARRCVAAAARYLVIPGALRTLAPLPVNPPLEIRSQSGQLLNNPPEPYWGHYEGDEDTRRKPAYHNGTAWTWTYPGFCEALAKAWNHSPIAIATATAYLAAMDVLLDDQCSGQLPEIVDGDAPHQSRGCDAQAWGVCEALRVWKALQSPTSPH